jgi:16S rRNA (uracil1498-N3)-methyltransferase
VHARFYAPDARAPGDLVTLPPDEGAHLTRVLRLGPGAAIRVFDGRGHEFEATVASIVRTDVRATIGNPASPAAEPRIRITLAQAVLKGDKMDDVVRDAVMIGVSAIQPLITARTEVSRGALDRGHRLERWQRIAVSSAKQCGRAVVPLIEPPLDLVDAAAAVQGGRLPSPALAFVEPNAESESAKLAECTLLPPPEATAFIGPEGGWTPDEIAELSRASRLIALGQRTLRADAMATIAVAALFARWEEY